MSWLNTISGMGITRKAKSYVSDTSKSQKLFHLTETSHISCIDMPMDVGWITSENKEKMASWQMRHPLKLRVFKMGRQIPNYPEVIYIFDRSYKPLDPFNRIKEVDNDMTLRQLAVGKHDESFIKAGRQGVENTIAGKIISLSFALWCILGILSLIKWVIMR